MTAIFDIGKTNKKLLVFDNDLKVVHESAQQFPETIDEDGFPCEDVQTLTQWMRHSFQELLLNPNYNIQKLNFSGYGASFVHLDRNGKPVAPLYNYLNPFPDQLKEKFYQTFASPETIAQETASPMLGNLNSGMQLFWLKYVKPDLHRQIAVSLHLPQYLSSVFTGHYLSDMTSLGCHTQLWNFQRQQYHAWVVREKIDRQLAPLSHADLTLPTTINGKEILCGTGLHDSSAALIPYLKNFKEPFVLISTGTWCISLNPFNHEPLTNLELQKDCLCYLSYQGNPVKASRLFSGHTHETETKRLAQYFHKSENFFNHVAYNKNLIEQTAYDSTLNRYTSIEEAYHALVNSLVHDQVASTQLILGSRQPKSIFVDGGFSKNEIFLNLLAVGFPKQSVFASSIAQASALGAALIINPGSEKSLSKNFTLKRFPTA